MPDQPTWIGFVSKILETLEGFGSPPFLDRAAVEALFGVRRRRAIQLLRLFGGYQAGKTFLVPREAVIAFLRDPQRLSATVAEQGRFERVTSALGQAHTEWHQRRISIPAPTETLRLDFSGLPPDIRLDPEQLTVRFATPLELLEKLFVLSQALSNDYEAFEQRWLAAAKPAPEPPSLP